MRIKRIPILYEDESLLVCEKPAGIPVQSDRTRDIDLQSLLKNQIFEEEAGEGAEKKADREEPWLEAVHRLDRPVGGLMVFARTRQAAADLGRQMQEGEFEKNYQAVLDGEVPEESGTFQDYLVRDGKTNISKIVDKNTPGAKYAELDYELIDCIETGKGVLSWVLIILHTGRHHQIRVQCAARGLPILGDVRYGISRTDDFRSPYPSGQKTKKGRKNPGGGKGRTREGFVPLGLYSTRLSFVHPVSGERMTFKTEPRGKAFELMDVETF